MDVKSPARAARPRTKVPTHLAEQAVQDQAGPNGGPGTLLVYTETGIARPSQPDLSHAGG
jgi:hypothetical protein